MHLAKRGLRVLGIAESYAGREHSRLAGVVMRRDLRIDGVAVTGITVGGSDATDGVFRLIHHLGRQDINAIMLSGCVIAWFNIIDPAKVYERSGCPLVVVTYEASSGLEEDIRHHFPDDLARLTAYRNLGSRTRVTLATGYEVFLRVWGCSEQEGTELVNYFTKDGRIPEPLRIARLIARAWMEDSPRRSRYYGGNSENSGDPCCYQLDSDGSEEHAQHPGHDPDHHISTELLDERRIPKGQPGSNE